MKKQVQLLSIEPQDSFSGYHKAVLQIPMFETIRKQHVAEMIKVELNETHELLSDSYNEAELKMFFDYANELNKTPLVVFYDSGHEEEEDLTDDYEGDYAFFAIGSPTIINGIRFIDQ